MLRTFIDGERDHNCNCNSQEFLDALRAGDGPKVASFMREAGVDVCFVERLQYWPAPSSLMQLQRSVRLATTLREPWQRLVSNYERDSELCRHLMLVSNASLGKSVDPFLYAYDGPHEILPLREYGEMRGCYPRIRYGLQLPDLYVRALNGAAKATTTDVAAMDDASLERAKEVLAAFDEVLAAAVEAAPWVEGRVVYEEEKVGPHAPLPRGCAVACACARRACFVASQVGLICSMANRHLCVSRSTKIMVCVI